MYMYIYIFIYIYIYIYMDCSTRRASRSATARCRRLPTTPSCRWPIPMSANKQLYQIRLGSSCLYFDHLCAGCPALSIYVRASLEKEIQTSMARDRCSKRRASRSAYRGTSLIRNSPHLRAYSRAMPRALRWS